MTRAQSRDTARDILKIVPVVMRTIAAELRAAGELPAPAHFGLLTMVKAQPRTLTELAMLQGVSLPTMSNSVSSLVQRGWVKRTSPARDRRIVIIEVTAEGQATLERVGKAAEAHLSERLIALDGASRQKLHSGLAVLTKIFSSDDPYCPPKRRLRTSKSRTSP